MAAPTPNTIILKAAYEIVQNEGPAGGTIKPGMLVSLTSAGTIVAHGVGGGSAPEKAFAIEDDLQGLGIDDDYNTTTRSNVRYALCPPGTEVYALIAANATIAIGDALESNGNGYLREHVGQTGTATSPATAMRTGQIVARALQAKDSSSPVGAGRLRVRVV